jgi:uncharacterized protein (DUF1501 family)
MGFTRRDWLRLGIGSPAVLACGHAVPCFLAHSAAACAGGEGGSRGRILVVVELEGGNDGLNTVVPYRDDVYYRSRPRLAVPAKSVLKLDDHAGLNATLRRFAGLLDNGQLAVVQGVGYPNPTRSHFDSMAIWQTARLDATHGTEGWLSRYLDATVPTGTLDPRAVQAGGARLTQALSGGTVPALTLDGVARLERHLGVPDDAGREAQRALLDRVLGQQCGEAGSPREFLRQSALVSFANCGRLREVLKAAEASPAGYPDYAFAQRLKTVAHFIKAGMTPVVYYTQLGGFDTHVSQAFPHRGLLGELAESTGSFFDDLERNGEAGRVLMLVYSEFGRRLAENAGAGTDHGTAGPVFLVGPGVRGGLHGREPDLTDLDDGDPKFTVDFRRVYATVLEKWLGCRAAGLLPGSFDPLPLLA